MCVYIYVYIYICIYIYLYKDTCVGKADLLLADVEHDVKVLWRIDDIISRGHVTYIHSYKNIHSYVHT